MDIRYYQQTIEENVFGGSLVLESIPGDKEQVDSNTTITVYSSQKMRKLFTQLGLPFSDDPQTDLPRLNAIETVSQFIGGEGKVYVKKAANGERVTIKDFGSKLKLNEDFQNDRIARGIDIFETWRIVSRTFKENKFKLAPLNGIYGNTGIIQYIPGLDLFEIYNNLNLAVPNNHLFDGLSVQLEALSGLVIDQARKFYATHSSIIGTDGDSIWLKSTKHDGEYSLQTDFSPNLHNARNNVPARLNNWILRTDQDMDRVIFGLKCLARLPKPIATTVLRRSITCIDPFLLVYTDTSKNPYIEQK